MLKWRQHYLSIRGTLRQQADNYLHLVNVDISRFTVFMSNQRVVGHLLTFLRSIGANNWDSLTGQFCPIDFFFFVSLPHSDLVGIPILGNNFFLLQPSTK